MKETNAVETFFASALNCGDGPMEQTEHREFYVKTDGTSNKTVDRLLRPAGMVLRHLVRVTYRFMNEEDRSAIRATVFRIRRD